MFSQIKDRKHIEQNFHSAARVMPLVGLWGAGGVNNFSVGICDGASSTARSSFCIGLKFPSYRNQCSPIAVGPSDISGKNWCGPVNSSTAADRMSDENFGANPVFWGPKFGLGTCKK